MDNQPHETDASSITKEPDWRKDFLDPLRYLHEETTRTNPLVRYFRLIPLGLALLTAGLVLYLAIIR